MAVLPGSSATKVGAPGAVKVTPVPDEPVSLPPPPPQAAKAARLASAKKEIWGDENLKDGIRSPIYWH